ncbi:Fructose-bisphosphate aldolase, class-I [Artemisia annua]|uniref:Fructose-bisphosphate aldolase n=1 Tax=Artemisia annua TaxID=35608 RepID=A0A2U1L7Z0_ARTAN|nr:Fructose-bisphosphate aldolase, class-I [Artemisia annua]
MNLSGLTGSPTKYCFHLYSRSPALPCKRTSVFQAQGKRKELCCLQRRNNFGGSTQRYVTKRISLVKCFGDARDDSSVIFPRINVKDPYKRLGISKEASEDEIQSARNFLVQKYAGHKPSVDAIESAHDKIIMQQFYERKNPKINVKKKMREVSQSRVVQAVTNRFRTPATNFIIKTAVAFVVLAALTVLFPTEEGPTIQGWNFYCVMASGNFLDGICSPTYTQRPKEFRGDNVVASLFKPSPATILDKSDWIKGQTLRQVPVSAVRFNSAAPSALTVRADYADELVKTAKTIATPGRGILAMDESNATCGKRLASIGLENTEANRQAYRTLLVSAPGLGNYISGAILFEETLYQSTVDGKKIVDVLKEQGIVPGIKTDKGLVPLAGSNDESWCQGLDGLASRSAAYYQQGARFAKWRTVVSIPNGPTALAVKEAAWGLARYAAISQDNGLVPIVEPEILLDGEHGIDRTFEVAQKVWAEVFFYLAENNVLFEGILLKPSMVTPGADCKERATPQEVAEYTLSLLKRRIPPAFLSGGQSEVEATLNLNAMNQSPNPWHVSFSYARALQNTCLTTWGGRPENVKAAQDALLLRASANSLAQLGKYTGEGESEEAKKGMFVKGYVY